MSNIKVKTYKLEIDGETKDFTESQFENYISENVEIPKSDHSKEDSIRGLVKAAAAGGELKEDEVGSEIAAAYDAIKALVDESKEIYADEKLAREVEREQKAAAKEKAEKEAAVAAEKLAKQQSKFSEMIGKSTKVNEEIVKGVKSLNAALPKGVSLTENATGNGFALGFDEGVTLTESIVAKSIGAIVGQQAGADAMSQTRGFLLGGMANEVKRLGLYPSIIKAAAAIAEATPEEARITGKLIEGYARMDNRIALDNRNTSIKDNAYLTLANAKMPKQDKGEDDAAFEARQTAYIEDRDAIAEGLGNGQIENAKEVKVKVDEMLIKHGMKEAPNPDAKSKSDYLTQYFFATFYKQELLGLHDKGVVVVSSGEDELSYTEKDLDALIVESEANLSNMLIRTPKIQGIKAFGLEELKVGEVTLDINITEVNEEGKTIVKKNDKGEIETEEKTFKIYPPNPFKS